MSTDLLSCLSRVSCRGAGTSDEKNSSAVEVRGHIEECGQAGEVRENAKKRAAKSREGERGGIKVRL